MKLRILIGLITATLFGGFAERAEAQSYFWDADGDTTGATGGTGNWNTASLLWRLSSSTGTLVAWPNTGPNIDAFLEGTAGTLTLTTGVISVNDITVNPTSAGTYTITGVNQTLTLNGAAQSVLDVASGSTLTITSRLAGTAGFTKSSAGTLILDSPQGTGSVFGSISVTGGTLQAGSATNNGASQVLRSNSVNLSGGTSLTTAGTTTNLRVGSLSGSGSVTLGTGGGVNILALSDSTFAGTMSGVDLNLRGANGTTQTFTGNLTGLTGVVGVNSGATLVLSGTGATNGVLGIATLTIRGGAITLDNSGGNTAASAGRIPNAASFSPMLGGTFSLIGDSAGTTETVGAITMASGSTTFSVTNNGGGAVLAFTDSGSLRDSTAGTYNFVGLGTGTLGSAGNAPRITFSGAINANTVNGALANTSSATNVTFGWARVNGTSWAGIGGNGIVALAEMARNSTTLSSAAAYEVTTFTPSTTTTTLSATLGAAASPLLLKVTPSATGQTLAVGTNAINASAFMLAGTTDFTITGTGAMFGTVGSTRYIYVTDGNTVLNTAQSFAGAAQPFVKSGAGTVNLNGVANQLAFGSTQSVNIAEGVLRGTLTSLGGGASTDGDFTTINLFGGVLEISGGGTFSRAIGLAGTTSGGGLRWETSSTARGDGGFSAVDGNATVTLVTTIGGSTAATARWDTGGFVSNGYALIMGSTKANSRIDFTNDIGLDDGTGANNYFGREVRVIAGAGGDSARLSGVISGSENADLLKTGGGVLELTATNTYTGNTLIQQGTLIATNGSAIPNSGLVSLANTAGVRLQLNTSETIGALTGGGTTGGDVILMATTLTVGDPRDSTFAGVISGTGGALTKQGAGTLTLAGINTYNGATQVNAGTLNVTGSTTGSVVTVGGGASLIGSTPTLGGSGTITGTVIISSPSGGVAGTLSPGNRALGTLTVAGSVTFQTGSTFRWEIGNGQNLGAGSSTPITLGESDGSLTKDLLSITGGTNTLTSSGTVTFALTQLGTGSITLDQNQYYSLTVATSAGAPSLAGFPATFTAAQLSGAPDFANIVINGGTVSLAVSGNSVFLNTTPVPEPITVGLIAASGLGLGGFIRRRVRK